MSNKRFPSGVKRKRVWSRYYNSKTPNKNSGDWITKECLNCDSEMVLEPKEKNKKFCSMSCATSYRNKNYDYSKRKCSQSHSKENQDG